MTRDTFSDFQFTMDTEVHSFQVSPAGEIRMHAVGDWFQEIAWRHANHAGFGTEISRASQLWAMARLDIQALRLPVWGEKFRLFTAGRGVNKLFAFREFLMCDQSGKPLIKGMSSWLLLDAQSKRPLRPELVLPEALFDPKLKPTWEPPKILIKGEKLEEIDLQVKPSDLDLNKHVNNTSYIRWAEDLIGERGLRNCALNYLAECHLGDVVTLSLFQESDTYFLEGQVSGKKVFTSQCK
ncbi:acyl-[acyl-carrier-protein] thioesterase [Algoriphagus namhaensis]